LNTEFLVKCHLVAHTTMNLFSKPSSWGFRIDNLRQLYPIRSPHAAQWRVLCGLVQVFAVVTVSYILTTCPCSDNLNLTVLTQVVFSATLSRLLSGFEHFQYISFS